MSSQTDNVDQYPFVQNNLQVSSSRLPARPSAPAPKSGHEWKVKTVCDTGYEQEPDVTEKSRQNLDRLANAWLGHLTAGLSPASVMGAFADWSWHLAMSPGKQGQLVEKAWRKMTRFAGYLPRAPRGCLCQPCIEPLPQDHRFENDSWREWPFNAIYQSFLLTQQWWHNATTNMSGVNEHHGQVVNFITRQILDMFSPSNNPFLNPEVINRTRKTGGMNFVRGYFNWHEDMQRILYNKLPAGTEKFIPGKAVAVTRGKVIYQNHLIELIQYEPTTNKVQAEPVLFVPAWIMKYYILDLSPDNSLVRWLLDQGYTVFMISWKNPDRDYRDIGLDDYRKSGILEALNVVNAVVPDRKVHAAGYCLGGTLLAITAAAMSREGDDRFASLTLLASLTDFTESGELELFIDESQVEFLEDLMWEEGYFDSWLMKSTFQFLRSSDLIWSRMVHDYLMGEREPMFDLMAWSTDATRLPYQMHSEYLRRLYLADDLAEGNYKVDGAVISLRDIKLPIFVVATRTDHIAPWQSVYKIQSLTDSDITFVLTSGGHNAGVVSEPGHPGRVYQIADKKAVAPYVGPSMWHEQVPERAGSWWPEWDRWLREHSSIEIDPPAMGSEEKGILPLADAPGQYVLQH